MVTWRIEEMTSGRQSPSVCKHCPIMTCTVLDSRFLTRQCSGSTLCCRLRFADWQARMQPLAGRLEEYRDQHLTCTGGSNMPEPYIVVRIEDKAAGIGNELPGVITGTQLAQTMTCYGPFNIVIGVLLSLSQLRPAWDS